MAALSLRICLLSKKVNHKSFDVLTLIIYGECFSQSADGTGSPDWLREAHTGHVVEQVKAGYLSSHQLIVRRGLVVLGALALLAVGVSVRIAVPFPETRSSETNTTLDWTNTTDVTTVLTPT